MSRTRAILLNIALACCCTNLGFAPAQETDEPSATLYWIFLTTGRSTKGVAADEIRTMQQQHLANFGRFAAAGKLLTAGPMNDPNRTLRGIVVVKAPDARAVDRMFETDPYVTEGFMKVEAQQVIFDHGRIATKVTPQALEELRVVIFSAPDETEQEEQVFDGQSDYVGKLAQERSILLAAKFVSEGRRRFAWIAKPRNDLKKLVDDSPAVTAGQLSYQIIPLYLGKGSLEGDESPP